MTQAYPAPGNLFVPNVTTQWLWVQTTGPGQVGQRGQQGQLGLSGLKQSSQDRSRSQFVLGGGNEPSGRQMCVESPVLGTFQNQLLAKDS